VSETGSLTAAELANALQTSPASISGAVNYLDQIGLIRRTRELGQRRDIFSVDDDSWFSTFTSETRIVQTLISSLKSGVSAVGPDTAPGARLQETVDFFEFLARELALMMDKWKASRADRPH
jgi:DNA-binding transcriptional regulator GbsR (MarR family)